MSKSAKFSKGDIVLASQDKHKRNFMEVVDVNSSQNSELQITSYAYQLCNYTNGNEWIVRQEKNCRKIDYSDYLFLKGLYLLKLKMLIFYAWFEDQILYTSIAINVFLSLLCFPVIVIILLSTTKAERQKVSENRGEAHLPRFQEWCCSHLNFLMLSNENANNNAKKKAMRRVRKYKGMYEETDRNITVEKMEPNLLKVICKKEYFHLQKQQAAHRMIGELPDRLKVSKTKVQASREACQKLGRDKCLEILKNKEK